MKRTIIVLSMILIISGAGLFVYGWSSVEDTPTILGAIIGSCGIIVPLVAFFALCFRLIYGKLKSKISTLRIALQSKSSAQNPDLNKYLPKPNSEMKLLIDTHNPMFRLLILSVIYITFFLACRSCHTANPNGDALQSKEERYNESIRRISDQSGRSMDEVKRAFPIQSYPDR